MTFLACIMGNGKLEKAMEIIDEIKVDIYTFNEHKTNTAHWNNCWDVFGCCSQHVRLSQQQLVAAYTLVPEASVDKLKVGPT